MIATNGGILLAISSLQYRDQSTRAYGKQRLPVALIIPTPETHADVLSCRSDFERTRDLLREIREESSELLSWSVKHHAKILSASEDISALLRVYIWRKNNPDSRPYIRALNLEGVHTKLIERNAKLLSAWFDTGLDADWLEKRKHGRKFTDKYGFSTEERRIRMRYLFPADSPFPGISDIQLYQHECSADLASSIHSILIVENHQSFLSLPPVSDVLAVDGGGYAAARLMNIPWFHRKRLIYWGDCDAHGLDILGKLRKTAPNLKSVCMDSDTFKRYIGYSTLETTGMLPTPDGLLPSEEKLFALLHDRALRSQTNRLEQELIPMEYVLKQLNTVLSTPVSTKH